MKFKKKIFAFIDILGFSSLVLNAANGDEKAEFRLQHFYNICKANPEWQKMIPGMEKLDFMVMSDSVVAAIDFEPPLEIKLFKPFLMAISRFQFELASFDIWVRGARFRNARGQDDDDLSCRDCRT